MFYICGVDESRMEKWRRFLNETGATRVAKFTSATNVVVVSPNQQERITIRKHLHQEDIAIVTVGWVVECVKQRKMISVEGLSTFTTSSFSFEVFFRKFVNREIFVFSEENFIFN